MKRIICIILTVCMLLTPVLAAPSFSDIDGNDYSSEIELLKTLEIMNGYQDGSFRPKDNLTRAEFAQVIAYMMNFDAENLMEDSNVFADVTSKDWFSNAISYVSSMGYMRGYPNGEFKPNNNITVSEAALTLVNVLGYKHLAQDISTVPVAAKKIGLIKGMSKISFNSFITRECVAKMVVNALGIDMCEVTGYGEDQTMEVLEGATILYYYHDVVKGEGIVTANDKISISGPVAPEDNIRIGSVVMKYSDYQVRNMVGLEVDYICKLDKETDICTLLYISETENNKKVTVDLDEYISFVDNNFKYYDASGSARTIKVDPLADVFKNNEFYSYSGDPFAPVLEGEAVFISTTGSSVYDVCFITEYKSMVVQSANKDSEIILNALPSSSNLDLSDDELIVKIFDESGNEITLDDIKKDDVLTVIEGTEIIEIYVSRKVVQGLTRKTTEKVTIDGVEYKLSDNVKYLYSDLTTVENSAEFYIDSRGEIVTYKNNFPGEIIYLTKLGMSGKGLKGNIMGRFFTMSDGLVDYEFEKDITVNGTKIKDCSLIRLEDELENNEGMRDVERMVLVNINSDNRIYSVDTPLPYKDCMENNIDAFCEVHSFNDPGLWFSVSASTSFGFKLITDRNSTKVMIIPADVNTADEKDYKVMLASNITGGYQTLHKVAAYNKGTDYGICDVIVIKSSSEMSEDIEHMFKPVALVKTIETTMNEDGDLVKRAYCQQGKTEIHFDWLIDDPVKHVANDTEKYSGTIDNFTSEDLEVGDMIQYVADENGMLTNFEVYYEYDALNNRYTKKPELLDPPATLKDNGNNNTAIIPTTVEKFDGKNISFYYPPIKAGDTIANGVTVSGADTYDYKMVYFQTGFEAVHIVELSAGKEPNIYAGTVKDIQIGDEIIIQNIWAQTMSATIIRRK